MTLNTLRFFFESNINDSEKKKLKRSNCSQILWGKKKLQKGHCYSSTTLKEMLCPLNMLNALSLV